MPMLLTSELTKIKVKFKLMCGLAAIAPVFLLFKAWIYCQFTNTKNISPNLENFFGVFRIPTK